MRLRLIELSPRLRAVAAFVPQGAQFADIGTDHARLPIYLLQQGMIAHAIAADLRQGPLDCARRNAVYYGLTERISFRLCDGLEGIAPAEANVVTIAGMGGETIASILRAAPWTARVGAIRLILQPMSAIPDLRFFLQHNGYRIDRETFCREGDTLYTVISAEPGEMQPMTPVELWTGRRSCVQDSVLWHDHLAALHRRAEKALSGLCHSGKLSDLPRRIELEQIADGLTVLLRESEAGAPGDLR